MLDSDFAVMNETMAQMFKKDDDLEKRAAEPDETGAVPASSFEHGDSLYAKVQRLGGKLNVEQRGIERVPEDERTDNSYWNIGSMVS